jgi:hypothetical protein
LAALVLAASLILSACGQAVPQDKVAYVGEWHAETMNLTLTQDGAVVYKRVKGNVITSINGPLRTDPGSVEPPE